MYKRYNFVNFAKVVFVFEFSRIQNSHFREPEIQKNQKNPFFCQKKIFPKKAKKHDL